MSYETTIYQSTTALAILFAVTMLLVPRKYFLVPFVLASCFVPTDQRIIMMGLDFTVIRMLVVVGVLRVFLYGEYRPLTVNPVDRLMLAWALCGALVYSIQHGSAEAVINRAGYVFTAVGLYWLFRQNIQSWEGIKHAFALFAVGAIVSLPFVLIEWSTGSNPFVFLGKVITAVREENLRCQAAFPHSIMMGLFWTLLAPVFLALARIEKQKVLYTCAFAASVIIVIASASSTPILVLLVAVIVFGAFPWRRYTGAVAWSLVGIAAGLHVVMNAPVWHLLARVNVIGGSTGWHRYNLIDKAVTNFDEWMVMGCRNTDHWGFGLGDVTNQYILEGVSGGAVTLVLFLLMIYVVLRTLLRTSLSCEGVRGRVLIWALFAMMVAHCIGFIGVSYFGQIMVVWYLTLAAAAWFAEQRQLARTVAGRAYRERTHCARSVCAHA